MFPRLIEALSELLEGTGIIGSAQLQTLIKDLEKHKGKKGTWRRIKGVFSKK